MSGKNPAFQFYPNDYFRDTRVLTPASRGVWMDVLCVLWWTEPGERQKNLSAGDWSRVLSVSEDEFLAAISEFERHNICDVERNGNGDVTLRSRRMIRDDMDRDKSRKRKAKHDAKRKTERHGNADVTEKSRRSSSSSSSSVTKVTLCGEGDSAHFILMTSEGLRRITWEQDVVARQKAGVTLTDSRLEDWAREAVGDALLMGELDHPAIWWRKFLHGRLNPPASSAGAEKKEPPVPPTCDPSKPPAV